MTEIELVGLEVFGHHGVTEVEREAGQTFVFDLAWKVEEPSADDISATVDYVEVSSCVRQISDSRRFQLLETLAAAVADGIIERFQVESVRVRVRKPGVDLPVEYSAAIVQRP